MSPWHADPPGTPLGLLLTGGGQALSLGWPSWLWDPASAAVGGREAGVLPGGSDLQIAPLGPFLPREEAPKLSPLHQALLHRAIEAALAARKEWDLKPVADRAQVFLRAADLLSGPRRAEVLAKTMVGQVRHPRCSGGCGGRTLSSSADIAVWSVAPTRPR